MYKTIDLFAGAGGLSYGFTLSKGYEIVLAVERDPNAKKTYMRNHPNTEVLDDVCRLDYSKIIERYGEIDLIIGGPPCQGFSNANRQKSYTISKNNNLIKEFVKAVCELLPQVFLIENVSMLRSKSHSFLSSEEDTEMINDTGIHCKTERIKLLTEEYLKEHHTYLLETLDNYKDFLWKESEYKVVNSIFKNIKRPERLVKVYESNADVLANLITRVLENSKLQTVVSKAEVKFAKGLKECCINNAFINDFPLIVEEIVMLQRMYRKYSELIENRVAIDGKHASRGVFVDVKSFSVLDYIIKTLSAEPYNYSIEHNVLNAADFGVPQKRERYIIIGNRKGIQIKLPSGSCAKNERSTVKEAIMDLEIIPTSYDIVADPITVPKVRLQQGSLQEFLRDSTYIYNHVVPNTRAIAQKRFRALKQGENFHDLDESLKTNYADAKRTQNSIYMRLKYNEPSGTVVNVRKSMWIHPVLDRGLSVREAARLQSFPDSYIFLGSKDSQYQQIGNAVPPLMARAIAEEIKREMES